MATYVFYLKILYFLAGVLVPKSDTLIELSLISKIGSIGSEEDAIASQESIFSTFNKGLLYIFISIIHSIH
ncbi:MAG: hypothetical protein PUC88_03175 [Clostridia bacterium]|nr:hypothetical protein [Clostridia bacterium]